MLSGALAVAGAAAAHAEGAPKGVVVSVGGLNLVGTQPEPLLLTLDYEMAPPMPITRLAARLTRDVKLGDPEMTPYPAEGQTTAVLFLIDTSDPARRRIVEAVAHEVAAMVGRAKPYHKIGLATFDSAMTVRAELGAGPDALRRALGQVRAAGQRTELFRRGAEAIQTLAAVAATRKALFLFSDGRAEDDPKAYPLSYMADAARAANVRVYAFCYTGVEPPPISCQNLSRLSEETGGVYAAANRALALPSAVAAAPFAGIDNGGRAVFDLSPAAAALLGGKRDLRVLAELPGERSIVVAMPIVLPTVPLMKRALARDNLPWTGAAAAALLVMAGLSIYAALYLARQRRAAAERRRPVAFLEFLDGQATRFPMSGGAVRIGRSAGNDVRLANTSISGHHAEINRRRDGTFFITDLKSMNGVAVNDARVSTAELHDGDEIDLGEVRFRFVVNHAEPAGRGAAPRPDPQFPGHVDETSREP
jgi:hypothetical protein